MNKIVKYLLAGIFFPLEWALLLFVCLVMYMIPASQISVPDVQELSVGKRVRQGRNHYVLGRSSLKKNEEGIWEMYIEGDAYERGLVYGELAQDLIRRQEDIFVDQINQFVPPGAFQQFLRLFVGFFNADIPNHVPMEYQQEIYGVSRYFSDKYNYIAPKYTRILNYHAAHDIGHALNDYSMIGCTSFALHGEKSTSRSLLVARNFDFYVGDAFAEDKLLLFVNPDEGHAFVSYSWAGFMGVASGMNVEGLTVSINASKSDLPTGSKTPISILAREILQYASSIDEAVAIAKKRETFVSESILVASAKDQAAVIIEKSPKQTKVFRSKDETLVCSNHYQSDFFMKDEVNLKNIANSDSKYRFERVKELLSKNDALSLRDAAFILRDQYGSNGDTLGMGNPRAINQLLVHHSFIAQPEEGLIYLSTKPWQLGKFIGYDLKASIDQKSAVVKGEIPADPFVKSQAFKNFISFRNRKKQITDFLLFNEPLLLSRTDVNAFISSNSESYITYELLGKYYQKKGNRTLAAKYYSLALTKELASRTVKRDLLQLIKTCTTKTN